MLTLFHNLTVPHDQNHVCLPDGGQSVGHYEAGSALHHLRKGLLHLNLCPGVNGGCGLVQYEHGRKAQHNPGNTEKLFLSLGQVPSVLTDNSGVSIRHPHDKSMGMGLSGCLDNLFLSGIWMAVGYIVPDGA